MNGTFHFFAPLDILDLAATISDLGKHDQATGKLGQEVDCTLALRRHRRVFLQ